MKPFLIAIILSLSLVAYSQTKYEYAVFNFGSSPASKIALITYPDNSTVDVSKTEPDINKQMMYSFGVLGEQGYKLVSVTETTFESAKFWTYYFIREKQ